MSLRRLLLVGLLLAVAASLASELAWRDGVGPFEYVAGIAAIGLLLVAVFRLSARAVGRA